MIQVFGSLVAADLAMWAFVLPAGPVSFAGVGWLTWGALLWLGLAASSLGYHLQYNLIAQIGATRASFFAYLVPLVGLILGVADSGRAIRSEADVGRGLDPGQRAGGEWGASGEIVDQGR